MTVFLIVVVALAVLDFLLQAVVGVIVIIIHIIKELRRRGQQRIKT